ncbi:hypothetical protein F5879DRAFT_995023 [Lentinula edodes]|nr:hypothetical protein F5879DRAFT_995023 [Lentinula edodes]
MSTTNLSGNVWTRAQLKVHRPSDLHRIKEQRPSEEICVLNVRPIDCENDTEGYEMYSTIQLPNVLSHAGGEIGADTGGLEKDDWEECADIYQELLDGCRRIYRVDGRKRRDQKECAYHHWLPQFNGMVDAFMDWSLNEEQKRHILEEIESIPSLTRLQNGLYQFSATDTSLQVWFVLVSFRPPPSDITMHSQPVPFISTRTYSVDVLGSPFSPSLNHSATFRVFRLNPTLCNSSPPPTMCMWRWNLKPSSYGRNSPTWRILHTCPCYQNELQEDDPLKIRMMVAMDGNDSLKCVEHRKHAADDSLAEISDSGVVERVDPQQAGGDYFLSRTSVDN